MLEKPLIVGARGVMGRRYAAILRAKGIEPALVDQGDVLPKDFDSVLIATPTAMHAAHIEQFLRYHVPILCEKPFTTSLKTLGKLLDKIDKHDGKVDMVNQYKHLVGEDSDFSNMTLWDYYNSGKDGLPWDCISVVALAEDAITLADKSPIWQCFINGKRMRIGDMDWAYSRMVNDWVGGRLVGHGLPYIRDAHAKVQAYIEASKH